MKLTRKEQEELIYDLVFGIVKATTIKDATLFLQDLLTKNEISILSKRLRIAKLLLLGMTYEDIAMQLHTSYATVAKIAIWLSERGDGFRKTIESLPKLADTQSWEDRSEWDSFKRRYSLYFWPELLLEEIVKGANKRQKERIKNALDRLDEKSDLHKKIESLLRSKL